MARRLCWLFALSLAGGAAAAPRYPVSARLELAPGMTGACDPGRLECGIVEGLREAFQAAVARMFEQDPNPNLRLVLSVKSAQIGPGVGGLELTVEARVQVLAPTGEPIDELRALGRGPLVIQESAEVSRAEGRAAQDAARDFEREYADSSRIGDYLVGKKVAPQSVVGVSGRSGKLVSILGGLGVSEGLGDSDSSMTPSLRVALNWGFFNAQVLFARSSGSYTAEDRRANTSQALPGDLTVDDLGFEAGVTFRPHPSIDLRLGPGVHYLFGDGTPNGLFGQPPQSATPTTFGKLVPDVFASASASFFLARNGPRLVVGVEGRVFFASDVDLTGSLRTVPAANAYVGGFFGLELPVGGGK